MSARPSTPSVRPRLASSIVTSPLRNSELATSAEWRATVRLKITHCQAVGISAPPRGPKFEAWDNSELLLDIRGLHAFPLLSRYIKSAIMLPTHSWNWWERIDRDTSRSILDNSSVGMIEVKTPALVALYSFLKCRDSPLVLQSACQLCCLANNFCVIPRRSSLRTILTFSIVSIQAF